MYWFYEYLLPCRDLKNRAVWLKKSQASLENFRTASNAGMPYVIPFDYAVFFFNTIDRDRIKGLTPRGNEMKSLFDLDQGRPTCGPETFLCGPNWIQNLKKNRYFDHFSLDFWQKVAQIMAKSWSAAQRPTWVGRPWCRLSNELFDWKFYYAWMKRAVVVVWGCSLEAFHVVDYCEWCLSQISSYKNSSLIYVYQKCDIAYVRSGNSLLFFNKSPSLISNCFHKNWNYFPSILDKLHENTSS